MLGDPRAPDILDDARTLLQAQAAWLFDGELRTRCINDTPTTPLSTGYSAGATVDGIPLRDQVLLDFEISS
jgi:hypothetical protein